MVKTLQYQQHFKPLSPISAPAVPPLGWLTGPPADAILPPKRYPVRQHLFFVPLPASAALPPMGWLVGPPDLPTRRPRAPIGSTLDCMPHQIISVPAGNLVLLTLPAIISPTLDSLSLSTPKLASLTLTGPTISGITLIPDPATESSTALITGILKDEHGVLIPASSLQTLTLTLYDKNSNTLLGGRAAAQNVLNLNNVTVDSLGNLAFTLQPADNVMVNTNKKSEIHVALFNWTWGAAPPYKANWFAIQFNVQNLDNVPSYPGQ